MASRADARAGRHIIVRVAGPEDAEAIEAVLRAYPRLMALPIQPMSSLRLLDEQGPVSAPPCGSGTYYLAATS